MTLYEIMPPRAFWWQGSEVYWELPFFSEAGLCCDAMCDVNNQLACREQLWAFREGLA